MFKERVSDEVLLSLVDEGKSDAEVAATTGEPVTYVAARRRKLGRGRKPPPAIDVDDLRDMIELGMDDQQIADRTGTTVAYVKGRRFRYGLLCGNPRPRPDVVQVDEERIRAMLDAGMSTAAIARELGISWVVANKRIKRMVG